LSSGRRGRSTRSRSRHRPHDGGGAHGTEVDRDPAPPSERALAPDPTAVIAHDAVCDRKPEPRPFTHALGGEERLEEARHVLRGDASAPVLDVEDRTLPLRTATVPRRLRYRPSRRDPHRAAPPAP